MKNRLLEKIDVENRRKENVPEFKIGDNVRVHVKIREGDKERVQAFEGTVIARDGHGATETFTLRRISYGEGVERVFPVYSPALEKIELERPGKARRAKLYYLRDKAGKDARIKEQTQVKPAAAPAAAAT